MVPDKKIFLSFFHYKSMGDNEPRGLANLDRIYVGDHVTLQVLNM